MFNNLVFREISQKLYTWDESPHSMPLNPLKKVMAFAAWHNPPPYCNYYNKKE